MNPNTEQQAKEIQTLAHQWIKEAEDEAENSDEDNKMTFVEVALGRLFLKTAAQEMRLRNIEAFINLHKPMK